VEERGVLAHLYSKKRAPDDYLSTKGLGLLGGAKKLKAIDYDILEKPCSQNVQVSVGRGAASRALRSRSPSS